MARDLAPGGCVVLESADLLTWRRAGFLPGSSRPALWPVDTGNSPAAFFRLAAP